MILIWVLVAIGMWFCGHMLAGAVNAKDPELIQIAVAFTMILVVLATTFIECEIILKCLG